MSREPIFRTADLGQIHQARAAATNDVIDIRGTDWMLKVTRDRSDIGIPLDTRLVARPQKTAEPGEMAVVVVAGEHVLRRCPTDDGPVVGVVVGVVVELPENEPRSAA